MRRRGRTPPTPRDIGAHYGTPFLLAQALGAEEARLARLHGECVEGVDALLCQARPDPHVGLTGEGWGCGGCASWLPAMHLRAFTPSELREGRGTTRTSNDEPP